MQRQRTVARWSAAEADEQRRQKIRDICLPEREKHTSLTSDRQTLHGTLPPASGVVDTLPDKGRDRLARCGSCDRLRESKEPDDEVEKGFQGQSQLMVDCSLTVVSIGIYDHWRLPSTKKGWGARATEELSREI